MTSSSGYKYNTPAGRSLYTVAEFERNKENQGGGGDSSSGCIPLGSDEGKNFALMNTIETATRID